MILTWVEVLNRLAEIVASVQQPEDEPQYRLTVDEQSSPPNVKVDARANRSSSWIAIGSLPAPADETPDLPVSSGGGLGNVIE